MRERREKTVGLFGFSVTLWEKNEEHVGGDFAGKGQARPCFRSERISCSLLQGSLMRPGVKEGAKVYAFVVLAGLENRPLQSDGGEQGGDEGHENQG